MMKSSLKRLDIVYRIVHILEIYFTGRLYIDLSILRVSVALSNKRENNNVIE